MEEYYKDEIRKRLFELQDVDYRDFHSRLIPNIEKEKIIGIRMPVLRKYAKSIMGTELADKFIEELPHRYYEENNLHMLLITGIRDFDSCLSEIERFLPHIDNWATCDLPAPKCFAGHKEELLPVIKRWIDSGETYTVRYGIGMLMGLYLDDDFDAEYVRLVAGIKSDEYYVNMMIAWYMATALAKQWDAVIPYIENHMMPDWGHRKTIQKAIESYRITDEQKKYIKDFR